ncbi:uncharacterized protein [Eurosta solidaginis]|uniref:uncharacterized protein n=1 Tax=Eurosta solidaginis TaxID=178769 RepID=UPI00353158F7
MGNDKCIMYIYSITLNNVPVPLSKYNLRRQIRRDSTNQGNTHSDKGKVIAIEVHDQPRSSTDTICSRPELEENVTNTDLHMSNMSASVTTMSSAMEESSTKIISNNPTAMIALQQLASISSVQSLERIMPTIRKNLLVNTENLYANRPGKLPRQSSKRVSQFETNRCPLCSRVYRSQAFLNEHMRQEHSVLI